jgi:predicted XRE-type DNA-binding protein
MVRSHETDHFQVISGGGSVFADIETPDANEEFNKALLTMYIRQAINRQRLTKNAAAARMSIEEPMVSALIKWISGKLLQRATDAPADRTGPGYRDHGQGHTA